MALVWPVDCDTPAKRTEYCYRAQELIRLIHNGMGKWYREGLTEAQWNNFPQKIKTRYPYVAYLSRADWYDFTSTLFEPIHNRIVEKLLQQRALLFDSTTWSIAVEDI